MAVRRNEKGTLVQQSCGGPGVGTRGGEPGGAGAGRNEEKLGLEFFGEETLG